MPTDRSSSGPRAGAGTRSLNGPFIQVRWRPLNPPPGVAASESVLILAVAKRLLPRAVDRNRFRRIAREAWRSRQSRTMMGQAEKRVAVSVFVRLMRKSSAWKDLPDGQLKRAWRVELDGLFDSIKPRS